LAISRYYVGQIPARPLAISVRDDDGTALDLSNYSEFNVVMLDAHNRFVDMSGSNLEITQIAEGRFTFFWPTDRTLFNKPGDYVFQLELSGVGKRDYTSEHEIRVRKLGGK